MLLNYITWNVRPEIFIIPQDVWLIGGFSVRWYGLLFALGFVFGYIIMQKILRNENIPDKVLDELSTYMLIFTVVGARLGHCLFYEPEYYLAHPIEILKVWEGGLASHGAAIAIPIGLWFFAKKIHKPYIWILDRIVIVVALAGFLIRMGNLMNSEIFGDITTLPWGFIFKRYYVEAYTIDPRHPTQIYEAIGYLATFILLYRIYWKDKGNMRPGTIFGLFMILIWSVRFVVEFIKIPQVDFENNMFLDMGQLLSIPLIIAGIFIFMWSRKQPVEVVKRKK
jgi:phosphatidylglycerol---prolipoprotein diacylglyceryl transferase